MLVTVHDVDQFIFTLTSEGPDAIYRKIVYSSTTYRPLDEDHVKFEVTHHLSCVINVEDGEGQYLLQMGMKTGVDYRDASKERAGTEMARKGVETITHWCAENGIEVMPGVVDQSAT